MNGSSTRFFFAALVSLVALPGCKDRPAPASASAPAGPEAATRPQEKEPRSKPTDSASDERIGTLPEGVGLPVGSSAPAVTLTDADGATVALEDLQQRGPLLVVFYRGGWCPFCNFQIRELSEAAATFQERGVTPVAVSVDRVDEAARTSATYKVPFPVLSDPDLVAHKAFRVTHRASDEEVERLLGFGMDLERSSGKDHHTIAIPSMFLLDREGIVRWAHAERDYKVRPSVEQLMKVIDAAAL